MTRILPLAALMLFTAPDVTTILIIAVMLALLVMGFLLGMEATTRSIHRATRRLSPPERDELDRLMDKAL